MATAGGDKAFVVPIEDLIAKATNPTNVYTDWRSIIQLCDRVNAERDRDVHGTVQGLLKHLVPHLQSGNERQALQALATLEALVHRCGRRVQAEVGKFRFLNELIKLLSPKYLANQTPFAVRLQISDMMQRWQQSIGPREPKIVEAFEMLKTQKLLVEAPPQPVTEKKHAKKPSLCDESKSKRLAGLLKSRNPNDLQAANRLIKNILQEENEREEKATRRESELDTISNNVKLLNEMLDSYDPTRVSTSELDILKELNDTLQKARPNLFRLASETDDKETEAIALICSLGDDVSAVLQRYKLTLEGAVISYDSFQTFSGAASASASAGMPEMASAFGGAAASADNELLDLGLEPVPRGAAAASAAVGGSGTSGGSVPAAASALAAGPAPPPYSAAVAIASNGVLPGSSFASSTTTTVAASTTSTTASTIAKPAPASAVAQLLPHLPPAVPATPSPDLLLSSPTASSSSPNAVNLMLNESPTLESKHPSSASGKSDLLDIDFFASSSSSGPTSTSTSGSIPSSVAMGQTTQPASNPLEALFAGLKIQTASGAPIPGHVLLQALLSQGQQGGAAGNAVNPALLAQIAAMSSAAPPSAATAQMSPARLSTGLSGAPGEAAGASLISNLPANYHSMNAAGAGASGAFGSPVRASGAGAAAVSLAQPPPRPSRSELAFQELELFGKEVLFSPPVRGDAAAPPPASSASTRPGAAIPAPLPSSGSSTTNGQQSLLEF